MIFPALIFVGNDFCNMLCYRTYPFLDWKWLLVIGFRCFTNRPFNYFLPMYNISINSSLIAPYLKNAPVQSHSPSSKNWTSQPRPADKSDQYVWLLPIKLSSVILPTAPLSQKCLIIWRVSLLILNPCFFTKSTPRRININHHSPWHNPYLTHL